MRLTRSLSLVAGLAVAVSTLAPHPAQADDAVAAARAHRQAHGAAILGEFARFLELPNVASDIENIRANAAYIERELVRRGAEVELLTLPDAPEAPPIVYGRLAAPGATRTLGLYLHYDGQPVDAARWTATEPWRPALYTGPIEDGGERRPLPAAGEAIDPEWRIYARGAGDDKAPLPALTAALDALAAAEIGITSNLVFFFEGEEEAGSPHLERYMRAYRDRLDDIDAWLIFDGPVHQSRRPQLVFGVRGYSAFDLTTYGATRYLHSGHYGNWAPNPALELAHLLAGMKDADGRATIEGFYDSTVPPGAAERAAIAALPDFDAELRRELGLAATEVGNAPLAERLLLPSLNIRGMESAAIGAAARNVIPTTATAAVDIRLAKGNHPEAMLDRVEEHLESLGYHVVSDDPDLETRLAHPKLVKLRRFPGYPAARTELDSPVARQVIAAGRRAAGEELVLMPTLGGSLPLYLFVEVLGSPVVVVPIANHDDNQHAPDENLRLANLWYGVDLMAALLTMPPER